MAQLLIADDDNDYCTAFKTGMAAFGHEVTVAHSGNGALTLLGERDGAFDLVFLDVMMSDGGGLSTLHAIRRRWPELPVVIISGRVEILDSPIFNNGLREAQKRMPKSSRLDELEAVVAELT